jgi:hypothetical protein
MLKKLLSAVAYLVLFLVATALFTYFLFPLDRLREYVEAKANLSSKYRLEIGSLEREGMGRLVLSDITLGINRKLIKRKSSNAPAPIPAPAAKLDPEEGDQTDAAKQPAVEATPKEAAEENEFTYIDIDRIAIDFDITELMNPSNIALGLTIDLLGGIIENGRIELVQQGGQTRTALSLPIIQDIEFGETEFFGALFSALLPSMRSDRVNGYLGDGTIELIPLMDEELFWYEGTVDIELGDIVALEPILVQRLPKVAEAVEVPLTDMRLGKCVFRLRVDRKDLMDELNNVKTKHQTATAVLFEKGECKGESLDYYIRKNSFILFPAKAGFSKGQMDFWTKLAFNPDYFDDERNDENGIPLTKNKELGQGLEFDRQWQRAQDVDGFYWMHCKGKLSKPRCRRGLPAEEKRRKKALKDLEKKQKKEEAKKRREERSKATSKEPEIPKGVRLGKDADDDAAAERQENARKRAEERRLEREARRKEREAAKENGPRQPQPPDRSLDEGDNPDDEGTEEGEEGEYAEGEEGEEEGYEEGEEEEDEEGALEEGEEGEEEEEGEGGIDDQAYPEEGGEGDLPPDSPEPMDGEELPEEDHPSVRAFP